MRPALLAMEQIHISVSPVPTPRTTSMASASQRVLRAILLILIEIVWFVLPTAQSATLRSAPSVLVVTLWFLQQDSV